jgi:hypothetical protein
MNAIRSNKSTSNENHRGRIQQTQVRPFETINGRQQWTGEKKMTTKVTIYKVTCDQGYMMSDAGTGYSLDPWGKDTAYFHGSDDGGVEYELPLGYEVAQMKFGGLGIYRRNQHVDLCSHKGKPALADTNPPTWLKKAQA